MKKILPAISSALYAAIISLLAKIAGAFYKIPLSGVLGAEGSGVYQTVFPLYGLLVTLCSGGVSTCVSAFVSKADSENNGVSHSTIAALALFSFGISVVPAVAMALLSARIASVQGNASLAVLYVILSPAVALSSASAVFKGYFQGKMRFTKPAIGALAEQLAKIAIGLSLASAVAKKGVIAASSAALFGVVAAEIISCAYLAIEFFAADKLPFSKVDFTAIKKIALSSITVTAGCLIAPLASLFDSFAIVNILSKQCPSQTATALYGLMSGSVGSVLALPAALYSGISAYVLPKLSSKKHPQNLISRLFEGAITLGIFFSLSLALYSDEIIATLYKTLPASLAETAAFLLKLGAPTAFFSALTFVCSAVAHARNKGWVPTVSLFAATIIRIILCPVLTSKLGINGSALSVAMGSALSAAITLILAAAVIKPEIALNHIKSIIPSLAIYAAASITIKPLLLPLGATLSAAFSAVAALALALVPTLIVLRLKKRKNV